MKGNPVTSCIGANALGQGLVHKERTEEVFGSAFDTVIKQIKFSLACVVYVLGFHSYPQRFPIPGRQHG